MIERFNDQRDWFFEKRLGLFVHWGLYAINGWHEQEMMRKNVRRPKYIKLAEQFNPTRFDPDAWLDLMEEAGMEYICFTTKHHEGFCLWDTQYTDFNVMNTPYGKDILGMLAEACHRRNVPLKLYYSCVDWHHPNYPNRNRHHEMPAPEADDEPDLAQYMTYVRNQLYELCTRYGEIHGIFWDVNVPEHKDSGINEMIRSLQPKAVINDRGYDDGDYGTPERDFNKESLDQLRRFSERTEACQALGMYSWGYRQDEDYYSDKYLMQSIDQILAKGGNYLLNVGPMADGTIAPENEESLRNIGQWYGSVREAFDGTEPASHLFKDKDILVTRKDSTLYLHLFRDPKGSAIVVEPLDILPRRAVLLNTGEELQAVRDRGAKHWHQPLEFVKIKNLPVNRQTHDVMVIRLEFDRLPDHMLRVSL